MRYPKAEHLLIRYQISNLATRQRKAKGAIASHPQGPEPAAYSLPTTPLGRPFKNRDVPYQFPRVLPCNTPSTRDIIQIGPSQKLRPLWDWARG